MKVGRGETHDLEAIEEIHRISPLSLATLVPRYEESRPSSSATPRTSSSASSRWWRDCSARRKRRGWTGRYAEGEVRGKMAASEVS
jgi:hypothetical protein